MTSAGQPPLMFHTGIVVDDLEKAMADYAEALGLRFAEPIPSRGQLRTSHGLLPRLSWLTYSVDGPHRIELLEHIDDTAWAVPDRGPQLDHVGYWVDDLAASAQHLESIGFPIELTGQGPDGHLATLSYHRDPHGGLFVELVDRAIQGVLEQWWSGADSGSLAEAFRALGVDLDEARAAFASRRGHHTRHATS